MIWKKLCRNTHFSKSFPIKKTFQTKRTRLRKRRIMKHHVNIFKICVCKLQTNQTHSWSTVATSSIASLRRWSWTDSFGRIELTMTCHRATCPDQTQIKPKAIAKIIFMQQFWIRSPYTKHMYGYGFHYLIIIFWVFYNLFFYNSIFNFLN